MLHADFLKMKSLHKPCSEGKPSSHTNNATRYLLPYFQATALWGLLYILLVTCLFSILPALGRKRAHYCTKMGRAMSEGTFSPRITELSSLGARGNPYITFSDYSLFDCYV